MRECLMSPLEEEGATGLETAEMARRIDGNQHRFGPDDGMLPRVCLRVLRDRQINSRACLLIDKRLGPIQFAASQLKDRAEAAGQEIAQLRHAATQLLDDESFWQQMSKTGLFTEADMGAIKDYLAKLAALVDVANEALNETLPDACLRVLDDRRIISRACQLIDMRLGPIQLAAFQLKGHADVTLRAMNTATPPLKVAKAVHQYGQEMAQLRRTATQLVTDESFWQDMASTGLFEDADVEAIKDYVAKLAALDDVANEALNELEAQALIEAAEGFADAGKSSVSVEGIVDHCSREMPWIPKERLISLALRPDVLHGIEGRYLQGQALREIHFPEIPGGGFVDPAEFVREFPQTRTFGYTLADNSDVRHMDTSTLAELRNLPADTKFKFIVKCSPRTANVTIDRPVHPVCEFRHPEGKVIPGVLIVDCRAPNDPVRGRHNMARTSCLGEGVNGPLFGRFTFA